MENIANNDVEIEKERQLHEQKYFEKLKDDKARRNHFTMEQYNSFIDEIRLAKTVISKNLTDKERRRMYHLKDTYNLLRTSYREQD